MKIKKVKWVNHPILNDLELDFTNSATGLPFETILFAGENGTGKTTILESISVFLNRGSFKYFESIEYVVNGKIYKAVQLETPSDENYFDIIDDVGSRIQVIWYKLNDPQNSKSDPTDLRHHGCVFSKARADYKTKQITSTTTKALDKEKYDIDNEDDFTSLKQLLVDVENQDNFAYAEANKVLGTTPKSWDDFYLTSNIFRFKSAFDNFFEKLKYDRVTDSNNEKSILFKKNGKTIPIDKLSTGEKQIVFRGIYLLKNSKNLSGAAIMIDEPELSMHPKWQKKILKYYKELFTDRGVQKAQILLASHSEQVLKETLVDKQNNLVIVLNDISGTIAAKKIDAPAVLPSVTSAETNYLAFDVISNDYHIELYGWLQEKESKNSVKACDDFIKAHALYNPSQHRKPSSNGATQYETLSTFIRNAIHHPDPTRTFTEDELRKSIELLIELCR